MKRKGKEKENREDLKKIFFGVGKAFLDMKKKIHEKEPADYEVDSIKIVIF